MFQFLDRFKSDKQLIEEETSLFAQVVEAENAAGTGEKPSYDPSIFGEQAHKAQILINRGYVANNPGGNTGGWHR